MSTSNYRRSNPTGIKINAKFLSFLLMGLLLSGCLRPAQAADREPLHASGTIKAKEIRIAGELGGRVLSVPVYVGDTVSAGDALAVFDTTPWLLQLGPAEAAIAVAQADLDALLAGAHPAEIEAAQALLELAKAERDGALAAWENAKAALNSPQKLDAQIVEANTTVKLAAQGVELAEAQLARERMMHDVYDEGSRDRQIAAYQVLAAEHALASAQADEATAQALLNQLRHIRNAPLGFTAMANAAEGLYRVAQEGEVVAQAKLDDLLAGPTAEEVAVAQAIVRQTEAEAAVLFAKIERNTLSSPIDGVVVAQSIRAGELAAPAATVLTVADLNALTLEVYVSEGRIGHVRMSQQVQVQVDSFSQQIFSGEVTRIGDQPEFTPRNVATAEERLNTFYAVEIRLFNTEGQLKPGMPADATF